MEHPIGVRMFESKKSEKKLQEYDLKVRPDRVGKYYKKYMNNYVFDCLTENFISKQKRIDFMKDIPIPFEKKDVLEYQREVGLSTMKIAENMAWVIGVDPHFKYAPHYINYLQTYYHTKIMDILIKQGRDAAEKKDYDKAAIYLRAALCIEPSNLHALYSYARVCRETYLESNDEESVGRFKAEALEFFEIIREVHPKFAQAYYYLGYAYLNMGLYIKANLTWKEFLSKSKNLKDKREIKERMAQIADPIQIESGYNAILSGKWSEGVAILEPYLDSKYKDWWPLSYYLGIGYISLGKKEEAISCFKYVLRIHPSHVESMDELADIYKVDNNIENEQKYRKKAELLRAGGHQEKAFKEMDVK